MTLQFVKNGETQITFGARDLTMQQIANDIVDALTADLNRPVVDATGLTGNFDFVMNFVQETAQPGDSDGLAFVEALKDQLGLKLESGTGSIETLMIGHIAEPSPN